MEDIFDGGVMMKMIIDIKIMTLIIIIIMIVL